MAKRFNSWPVRGGVNGPSTGTVAMREPNEAQFINPPVWAARTGTVAVVAAPPKVSTSPRRVTIARAPVVEVARKLGKRCRIQAVR